MTEADVDKIESELGITLPMDYREIVLHFPVRFEAGTTDGFLWDDAAALIERNRELTSARKPWGVELQPLPEQYFFIGDDKAGWQYLIDTTSEPSLVYIMEYESIERIQPISTYLNADKEHVLLSEWFHDYLKTYRDDGVDITAKKFPASEPTLGGLFVLFAFCCLIALVFVLLTIGIEMIQGK
ncbi:hypothetical protein C5Y96_15875 [Blastopirellula marina]|uniref:Knr4/Smi1-like domain-containing protein n=1 Tax=Blastopirellula marina TaxID=124 RepID=A0A2S8FAM4_9BACT|nr:MULTISPECIES: SMI1/KNR4 family protein [Pirellulaceae]PQO29223.1 hypothetical protein C5Y96_15875 [Blastopirellula marina]RCS50416.1 hypothetical protein DTL36_15895 [Bremerella cremea]